MVAKLSNFTQEVIQVAAQGAEGKLGVQAHIAHEHGVWKEFVQHLNTMTCSYMEQVVDIANVCTSVADGDLSKKITVAAKGQTLGLKDTINTMGKQVFYHFFLVVFGTRAAACEWSVGFQSGSCSQLVNASPMLRLVLRDEISAR